MITWEPHIGAVIEILRSAAPATSIVDLLPEISQTIGAPVTSNALYRAVTRLGFPHPTALVGEKYKRCTIPPPPRLPREPTTERAPACRDDEDVTAHDIPTRIPHAKQHDFARLVSVVGTGATIESVCDALDMCPAKARALVQAARKAGYALDIAGDTIARRDDLPDWITTVEIAQIGRRTRFAVIADTHFGSRYCQRAQLLDFWDRLRDMGVSHVLHAGDLVEGLDPKVRWELSHHDIYAQLDDALAHIPDDIRLDGITGNHDAWLGSGTGLHVPTAFNDFFHTRGRPNVRFHNSMNHTLLINNTLRVRLKHPAGGKPYARSYKGQVEVRELPSATATKPHVWCFGHRHGYVHFFERGIHCIDVPCWVGNGSDFSKRLHGAPAIGGIVLDVGQLDNGLVRDLAITPITYYETETVTRVA